MNVNEQVSLDIHDLKQKKCCGVMTKSSSVKETSSVGIQCNGNCLVASNGRVAIEKNNLVGIENVSSMENAKCVEDHSKSVRSKGSNGDFPNGRNDYASREKLYSPKSEQIPMETNAEDLEIIGRMFHFLCVLVLVNVKFQ